MIFETPEKLKLVNEHGNVNKFQTFKAICSTKSLKNAKQSTEFPPNFSLKITHITLHKHSLIHDVSITRLKLKLLYREKYEQNTRQ